MPDVPWTGRGPVLAPSRKVFFRIKKNNPEKSCTQQKKQRDFGILRISIYLGYDACLGSYCVAGKIRDCVGHAMGQALIGMSHARTMD